IAGPSSSYNAQDRRARLKIPPGESDEAIDGYKQRRGLDHPASIFGRGVLRAWCAKNAGMVRRLWFSRHHGGVYAYGNAGCSRISDHLHGILWRPGAVFRLVDAHRRFRSWRPDDWGDLHGSSAERFFYELDGDPEGGGIRIPSAGARHGRGTVIAGGGSVLAGPGAIEVNCAA